MLGSPPTSSRARFGVIGGYGATGKAVVAELLRSTDGEILLGARDRTKLESASAAMGARVSALPVDVFDAQSLDEFCSRCSLIVNCAGPVSLLQDRAAQAAYRAQRHYVDPAGMSFVKERLLPHAQSIAGLGLSFVVSAGWTPGLTELLPVYAHARASTQMDSIDSLNVHFTDSGDWSDNALRDAAFYFRKIGLPKPGYFRKGTWTPARLSQATCQTDLGDPIGLRRFSLVSLPELDDVGRRLSHCDFSAYSYLPGVRTTASALMLGTLPLPEKFAIRLLRGIFRRNRLPLAGFVTADVAGRSKGRRALLKSRIVFEAGRDYWITGVTLATVARLVSSARALPGVHFLTEAIDPMMLMTELRQAGLQQSESFGQIESR
jgi:saccharopine dehydrogenase (NAD+, L-lysine forming)